MELFPVNVLESLDFDLVRQKVASYCYGPESKTMALELTPAGNPEQIQISLKATDEILALLLSGDNFPSTQFESIIEDISILKTSGTVLEEKSFGKIRGTLILYGSIYEYLHKKEEGFDTLKFDIHEVLPMPEIIKVIDKIIDERSRVRSNASRELSRIREELTRSRSKAARIFERAVKKYRDKGMLAEFDESISEDRRVLAIQSSYKGQIQGIFHGSSSRGSIVFIEPGESVEVNNEIAQLVDDERQEIHRILKELSQEIRPHYRELLSIHHKLVYLDFVKAKAIYARSEDCCLPEVTVDGEINIIDGYNPVLKMLNREKDKDTRSLDLRLDENSRILVISGPNAGGKTIAMKTLGLHCCMLQSGLLIPVHPRSQYRIFERIYADIGDSQSIQNELSTYSSKLQKMKHFLFEADKDTLLLIDEFGSGSDPELGSSLAQVFLEKLNSFGVYGIFTTHYNAIKALAAELPGVSNAAMLFDKKTLTPEYVLETGNPGSSYTFEVAGQSGIPAHIIESAREKTSKATLEVDQLLVQLQDDKLQLEKKQQKLNDDLVKIRKLEREKQDTIEKLEDKLSKQSRLNEENDRLIYWGQRFQKLVEAWLDQKSQKDKKEVVGRFIGMLNQRSTEVEKEEKKNFNKAQSKRDKKINQLKQQEVKVGDRIRMLDNGMSGVISEIRRGKYIVAMGNNLTATLEREKFIPADASLDDRPKRKKRKKNFSNKSESQDNSKPKTKGERSSKS